MQDPQGSPRALRSKDWTLLIVADVLMLTQLGIHFGTERFALIFKDLGSTDALPWITQFAMTWWFPVAFAAPTLLLLGNALRPGRDVEARRKKLTHAVIAAVALSAVSGVVFIFAMYLPIFALAGKIKAE